MTTERLEELRRLGDAQVLLQSIKDAVAQACCSLSNVDLGQTEIEDEINRRTVNAGRELDLAIDALNARRIAIA